MPLPSYTSAESCLLDLPADDYAQRFGGIARLYGTAAAEHIRSLHVCVVGLGGVGSWTVEALARTGVGSLTLIDYDTVCHTNVNRQIHALTHTVGQKKVALLTQRVATISPECVVQQVDDYINAANLPDLLAPACGYHYVVDAIDSIKFKAAMIHHCRRNKIPIITTGGAGGLTDPTQIQVKDLSRTFNDPLAAKVRAKLREGYGFTRNPKRYFGVECVFSSEPQRYPRSDGSVGLEKPGVHGISLDCRIGYGSASFVTAGFGFVAAARVINRTVAKHVATRGTPGVGSHVAPPVPDECLVG
jgi:tRNA threonylcarbamoyladenosine dehydratase